MLIQHLIHFWVGATVNVTLPRGRIFFLGFSVLESENCLGFTLHFKAAFAPSLFSSLLPHSSPDRRILPLPPRSGLVFAMAETEIEPKTARVGTETTIAPTEHQDDVPRPRGWMYKRLGTLGWYASPKFQLGMVAFVCFLCPGMFNALSGLGGGGKSDPGLADDMVRPEMWGGF